MPSTVFSALQAALPLQHLHPDSSSKLDRNPAFIAWPLEFDSTRVQDVIVDMPADVLFEELWGADARVAAVCRAKVGTREYVETDWHIDEQLAESDFLRAAQVSQEESTSSAPQATTFLAATKLLRGNDYKSRCRMNCAQTSFLGRTVYSFERERCLEAAQGGPYAVEICVYSTATMGTRFRCVFLHRVTAVDEKRCRWTAEFALVFVEKTNFLLKKTIETGANSGVKHNFSVMAEALTEMTGSTPQ